MPLAEPETQKKSEETLTWSARVLTNLSGAQAVPFRIFRFFASIQLAIFVILGLMAVFAAGTIVESYHGAKTAAIVVYQSHWFSLLLFTLGLNVTASAVDRMPWKKKHIGFVMTHAGIIIILIGSFITKAFMVDGQMAIAEGGTEHQIALTDPYLYILEPETGREWRAPLSNKPFAWEGSEKIKRLQPEHGFAGQINLISDFPKGLLKENLIPSQTGSPAIKVRLFNSFVDQTQWLMKDSPTLGFVRIGPARLRFTGEFLKENAEEVPDLGYLEFQFPNKSVNIPLSEDIREPVKHSLEDTPYTVKVMSNYRNAAIVNNQLVEKEAGADSQETIVGENPAVVLLLEGTGFSERHTVFARFPDFPTVHGMKPSQTGVRIFYRLPGGGSRGESHELRFVQSEDKLFYQVQDGFRVTRGDVKAGEEVPLGWMDLKFQVEEFYPHAVLQKSFTAVENTSERPDAFPAIRLELAADAEKQTVWLAQGFPEQVKFGNKTYHFLYGQKKIPAGFKLTLQDFRVENYPGTSRPASFESDVVLKDDFRGVEKEVNISMNHPLDYNGYRVFQASYMLEEGQPDVSVFSVVTDPGIPVKYGGVIIMLTGVLTMFLKGRFRFKLKNQNIDLQ